MSILEVGGLCKNYPGFSLSDVSFSLEKGKITGFIGRNGAGKSTTLGCILNFIHSDSGEITVFDKSFSDDEAGIKQKIGYVSGAVNFYPKKKLRSIAAVTKQFYSGWDDAAYEKYCKLFSLDENKTPSELSAGMKVKFSLALALSHGAELLVLDEPTSGLDPVSRDELLEIFLTLKDEGKTILFSTHITSDLDFCADNILYIQKGKIAAESPITDFVGKYRLIEYEKDSLPDEQKKKLIGEIRTKNAMRALIIAEDRELFGLPAEKADLESCMVHLEKESDANDR